MNNFNFIMKSAFFQYKQVTVIISFFPLINMGTAIECLKMQKHGSDHLKVSRSCISISYLKEKSQ